MTEHYSEQDNIIYFWPRFVAPILSGQKIQTRRAGSNRRFSAGQQLEARNSETDDVFATLTVETVFEQILKDVSEEEAYLDGFGTRDSFLDCIKQIYPELQDNDTVTVVQFRVGNHDN